jgi:hypothetical protein
LAGVGVVALVAGSALVAGCVGVGGCVGAGGRLAPPPHPATTSTADSVAATAIGTVRLRNGCAGWAFIASKCRAPIFDEQLLADQRSFVRYLATTVKKSRE